MPQTPDRRPGALDEERILLEPQGASPSINGELLYKTGVGFRFFEEGTEKGLTGTGISEAQHEALDTLTHDLTETSFDDVAYDGSNRVSSVITWTSSGMTTKVREEVLTYDGSSRVSQVDTKQYASDGTTVVRHVREVFVYGTGNRIEDITRTRVV